MTMTMTNNPYRVRRSPIHGTGVFATRGIDKGTRVIEYVGERISHREADKRYAAKAADDNHTFLFTVDSKIVIDAGVDGNAARFINHSCDPNCETVIERGRVFIDAMRDIRPGEELSYDYLIGRSPNDPPDVETIFACRCGASSCRGTMLAPREKPRRRRAKKAAAKPRTKASTKPTTKGRAKRSTRPPPKRKKAPARRGRATATVAA
jgi:SET domain-containing protein